MITGLLGEAVTQQPHFMLALCSPLEFAAYEVPVKPFTIVFLYGKKHCTEI